MSKFNYIINPKTMDKVPLYGQEGGKLLENYVNIYKNIRNPSKNKVINPSNSFKEDTKNTHNED